MTPTPKSYKVLKGRAWTPERKLAKSIWMKAVWSDPEKRRKQSESHIDIPHKHGHTLRRHKDKFYRVWSNMYARCYCKSSTSYRSYGLVGIRIEWKSFLEFKQDMYASFLEHLEKHGPKDTTIDRKDVYGNYCKENCRWATRQEQYGNKRPLRERFFVREIVKEEIKKAMLAKAQEIRGMKKDYLGRDVIEDNDAIEYNNALESAATILDNA